MRILFLTRSFNSLAQRLWLALTALGHEVSIELDIADAVTIEAVDLYRPDLVIAPFLQRAIPEAVWRRVVCLVVHPGIVGDRGPSALDWAIVEGRREWGVTVLQANAEFDAGPVWASEAFAMRDDATKSCLYRHEVTEAASRAVLRAVRRFAEGGGPPGPDARAARPGRWHASMRQADRRIDWRRDDTRSIVTRIRAADGSPGVLDSLFGTPCHLYDAHAATRSEHAEQGTVIARRNEALLRATVDGAVWIGQARRLDGDRDFKLPATIAFPHESAPLPDRSHDPDVSTGDPAGCEIRHESEGRVAFLHFDFYNGAMSTAPCQRLNAALRAALARRPAVLVLLGGADFWSNGIHLHVIEAADSPADESMRNIEAMNDVVKTLIEATGTLIVAAMRGNAGAGGAFLALAADEVWARHAVILNPHYKNMGNLHGSEYWTYLLPHRLRRGTARDVMASRLPLWASQAAELGLVDVVFEADAANFLAQVRTRAAALADAPTLVARLALKQRQRLRDESEKPLAAYRDEELAGMRRNFYGFDTSYHIARSNFVRRTPPSWTPRHLALHRAAGAAARRDQRP